MISPYICVDMIVKNEEKLIRYSLGSIYSFVDQIVICDGGSTDKTIEYIKELDIDKKITILTNIQKGLFDYSVQRNICLDYIRKNIFPKYRNNLYIFRVDADEVYFEDKLITLKEQISNNLDAQGFRFNFYTFDSSYHTLDGKNPTESRVNLFRFNPSIRYFGSLHEMPFLDSGGQRTQLYADPLSDKMLGNTYLPGYWYLHFTWCEPSGRFAEKAKIYTKYYIKNGTETENRLNTITPDKDSWWWHKGTDAIEYKSKYPKIFEILGYFEGQRSNDQEDENVKISVFTIVKNSILYDYPIIESIKSALPIADEVIVNLGDSEDSTKQLLHKVFDGIDKVRFFDSKWESRAEGIKFLWNQTNIAKNKCSNEICLYLQADEVLLDWEYDKILLAAKTLKERQDLVAAKFNYRHFDGSFDKIAPGGYKQEVRLIKRDLVESIGDAQSFGIKSLNLKPVMSAQELLLDTDIYIHHYGWTRSPEKMLNKLKSFDSYYHDDKWMEENHGNNDKKYPDGKYNFGDRKNHIDYDGFHPIVMYPRIRRYEKENPEWCQQKAKFNGE